MSSAFSRSRMVGASVGVCVGLGLRSQAQAAQFEYKLASPDAPDNPSTVRMQQMAQSIAADTGGRLQIQVFPNSQLGNGAAMIAQLRAGAVQLAVTGAGFLAAVVPIAQISTLGFAFKSSAQALSTFDGPLGALLVKECAAKGLYLFGAPLDLGFRQITTSTRPVRLVEDFSGLKIRVTAAPIMVDMFKTLGASPTPVDPKDLYTALQTKLIDGQDVTLIGLEGFKLYEVQKYLSITNHSWGAEHLIANSDAWSALPQEIQAIVNRNVQKYITLQRQDVEAQDQTLMKTLTQQGLVINVADTSGMRARLGNYYAKWKLEFGPAAWSALEQSVGRLG